jgi:hypothetical protein
MDRDKTKAKSGKSGNQNRAETRMTRIFTDWDGLEKTLAQYLRREENRKKGLRWSWAKIQMGNPK